jgi:hypothetical protein
LFLFDRVAERERPFHFFVQTNLFVVIRHSVWQHSEAWRSEHERIGSWPAEHSSTGSFAILSVGLLHQLLSEQGGRERRLLQVLFGAVEFGIFGGNRVL